MISDRIKAGIAASLLMGIVGSVYLTSKPSTISSSTALTIEQGCSDRTTLEVVRSLRSEPNKWETDSYQISRGLGWFDGPPLRIWIGNEAGGLDFNLSDNAFSTNGIKYPFTDDCRMVLYQAITQLNQAKIGASL